MNKNKLTFWGVRGSNPTPDRDKMEYGGHTSCVSCHTDDNELLVFDMGSGLKNLGENLVKDSNSPKNIHIILSHYHWDHMIGLLSFAPLFIDNFNINFYGKKEVMNVKEIISYMMNPIFWPVNFDDFKANLNFNTIEKETIKISDSVNIKTKPHGHPNGALSFRTEINNKVFTYITDCEHPESHLNQQLINLAQNSDILIHDAHFTDNDLLSHKGWGHSSWQQAVDMAKKTNSKELVLFHHNPLYNDKKLNEIEFEAQQAFKKTTSAKQGLVIYL